MHLHYDQQSFIDASYLGKYSYAVYGRNQTKLVKTSTAYRSYERNSHERQQWLYSRPEQPGLNQSALSTC
jgi:hypothetical protein